MSRWVSLAKADTGFVFCKSTPDLFGRWDFISGIVAEEFECSVDDLDTIEDDDGREVVTLHGEPIVEVIQGYVHNAAPYKPFVAEAAE